MKHAVFTVGNLAKVQGRREIKLCFGFHKDGSVTFIEKYRLVNLDADTEEIAKRHFRKCLGNPAETYCIGRNDVAGLDLAVDIFPVALQLAGIRHPAGQRRVPDEVQPVSLPFEFRGDHFACIDGGDAEGYESWRDVDMLERAAHGILAAY